MIDVVWSGIVCAGSRRQLLAVAEVQAQGDQYFRRAAASCGTNINRNTPPRPRPAAPRLLRLSTTHPHRHPPSTTRSKLPFRYPIPTPIHRSHERGHQFERYVPPTRARTRPDRLHAGMLEICTIADFGRVQSARPVARLPTRAGRLVWPQEHALVVSAVAAL
jgi:hypothetical protein